jgi:tRNA G37 N-methylase Trm5
MTKEMHVNFWSVNLLERNLSVNGNVILKVTVETQDVKIIAFT